MQVGIVFISSSHAIHSPYTWLQFLYPSSSPPSPNNLDPSPLPVFNSQSLGPIYPYLAIKWVLTAQFPNPNPKPVEEEEVVVVLKGSDPDRERASEFWGCFDFDMLGSGLNLVTTVIGFGMSATFIVFICARLICGRIRSADSRAATFDIEERSDLDSTEHTINGLEPVAVAVASIPTMKYSREGFHSREDAQCSICLGDYQEKEILRIMPTCRHNFHLACIDVWLQKQSTCPICRLPLNDSFEASPIFSSNQWLLPIRGRSEGIENDREIHDSLSVNIPHAEPETVT